MARSDTYLSDAADRVMIADLLARYVWAADYGTPEEWADQFTPDGTFGVAVGEMRVAGRERLMEFMVDLQRTVPHLHHVTTSLKIELDGDRATGKAQLNEFLSQPEAIYPNIHGWYEDEYVFNGERWLIKSRRVHMPHPENTTVGIVGEYFKGFWEACEKYRD
jgi:hypothetical protein